MEYGLIGTEWENAPKERKKELVEQACEEAFADEFITRLPEVRCITSGADLTCQELSKQN